MTQPSKNVKGFFLLLILLLPLSCSPPSEDSLLERAAALQGEGKMDEAALVLEEAVGLFPESSNVHLQMAKLYSTREEYGDAVKHYTRALELNPDNLEAHLNFSGYYYKRKNYLSSLEHLEEVITRSPESQEATMAGNLYRDVEMSFARSELRARLQNTLQMPETDPQSIPMLRSRLAQSYADEGAELLIKNDPSAVDAYREAVGIDPDSVSCRVGLAKTYELHGEIDQAVEHLERAFELDPNNPRVLLTLAGFYSRLDRQTEAVSLLTRLIEQEPFTLESELGRRRLEELERAMSLVPSAKSQPEVSSPEK